MSSAEEKLSQGYVIVSANSMGVTGYYPTTGGDSARLFTAEYAARGNVWGGDNVSLRSVGSSMVGDTLEVNEHGVTLTGATNMIFTNKTRRNYRHKRVYTYPSITINPSSFEEPKSLPASRLNMEEVSRFFLGNFSIAPKSQQLPVTIGEGKLGWNELYSPKTQTQGILTSQLYAITPPEELPRWGLINEYFHNRLGWVLWGLYQSGGHPDEIRKQTKKRKVDGAAAVLGEISHVKKRDSNYVHLPLILKFNRFGNPNLWGVSARGDHYYPVGELYKYSNVPEGSMGYGEWLQRKYGMVELGTQGVVQGALF